MAKTHGTTSSPEVSPEDGASKPLLRLPNSVVNAFRRRVRSCGLDTRLMERRLRRLRTRFHLEDRLHIVEQFIAERKQEADGPEACQALADAENRYESIEVSAEPPFY